MVTISGLPFKQIRQPVCAQTSGGSCVGGMQQCCEQQTRTKTTCKKVPYNVQEVITVPGKDSVYLMLKMLELIFIPLISFVTVLHIVFAILFL